MLTASDLHCIERALREGDARTSRIIDLTVRLLDDDLLKLISQSFDTTQSSILSGLLNTRKLAPLSNADIDSAFTCESLTSMDQRYAKLAFCCRGRFLYGGLYDHGDIFKLRRSGLTLHYFDNFDLSSFSSHHVNNIIDSYDLIDGGVKKPSEVIGQYLAHAKRIVIYDRYFKQAAASALDEILSVYGAGQAPFVLDLYIGTGHNGWSVPDIAHLFGNRFQPGALRIFKSTRPANQVHHTHDRYIQVDNRITVEMSSGLSAFYDDTGVNLHNRSSSIIIRNLSIGSSLVYLVEIPSMTVISLRK